MCYVHNWDDSAPQGWQRTKYQLPERWVEVQVGVFEPSLAFLDDGGQWRDAKTFKPIAVILWRPI